MATRPTPKPVSDWETVSASDPGDWETVGAAPNAGLAPPASPAAPQPLQQNPNWQTAAREGTLKDLMSSQAAPIAESAQYAGSFMGNPVAMNRGLATGISGLGKTAGFAEKFLPWSRLSRGSEAIEEASQGLAGKIRNYAQGLESQTARYPRQTLAEQIANPPTAQRAAQIPQPKPSVGRYQPPERVAPRSPRPDLIKQMGGKPVEEMTDAALKQKMEQSPEVTYGKYAKRHAAGGSATYPEPENWQDQPPENAPWGGRFYRR